MADKELTYPDVAEHNTKKDVYVVIHDKVYNATSFLDEHPGGEEVILDVAGQDATEAFEDVGHSDEAREILTGLSVGSLKRQAGDPEPATSSSQQATDTKGESTGLGSGLYVILALGVFLAAATYYVMQDSNKK